MYKLNNSLNRIRFKIRYRQSIRIYYYVILSNLKNILKIITSKEMAKIIAKKNIENYFRNITYIRNWDHEIFNNKVEWVNLNFLNEVFKKHTTVIACSFHYGNYYIFPVEAAKLGYKVKVIVGNNQQQINFIKECALKTNLSLEPIIADNRTLVNLIKTNNSDRTIIYLLIDEFGGIKCNEKLLNINFLDQYCHVKKGIGWLYYKTHWPIIPIVTKIIDVETCQIKLENKIIINKNQQKENIINSTVKELFKLFENYIIDSPEQWLNWVNWKRYEYNYGRNNNKFNFLNKVKLKNIIKIENKKIKIFKYENEYIIIDMERGKYFQTSRFGYQVIQLLRKGITQEKFNRFLISNNVDEQLQKQIIDLIKTIE